MSVRYFAALYQPNNAHSGKKQPDNFGKDLAGKSKVVKIFDGEMSMSTFLTTLLQIFCTIIFKSEVIVKSIPDPDVNFWSVKLYGDKNL